MAYDELTAKLVNENANLKATIERLTAALKPFADAWGVIPPEVFKWLSLAQLGKVAAHEVSGTHFQRAHAALTGVTEKSGDYLSTRVFDGIKPITGQRLKSLMAKKQRNDDRH